LYGKRGAKVKVYDKKGNFIKEFSSLINAGKYFNVSYTTIRKYGDSGRLFRNYNIKIETKNCNVIVYDKIYSILGKFPNITKAAVFCGVSDTTIGRYLKSKNLLMNKYYFSKDEENIIE
jgi:NUMOD1 domain-containing protein